MYQYTSILCRILVYWYTGNWYTDNQYTGILIYQYTSILCRILLYRGAMETPQHGNVSMWKCLKKLQKPLNNWVFWGVSIISVRKTEIPQTPVSVEFPLYFEVFPKIFEEFSLFTWQLFLRNFPIFLRDFSIFLRRFRKIFEVFLYF